MRIAWINKENSLGAITIYNNNITLNKQAANFFNDAYAVAIGIDQDTKNIVIKNVSKEEVDNEFQSSKEQFHKIAIKSSYGRITGKKMIDELSRDLNLDFTKKAAYKFSAKWNTGYKMLVVNTQEEELC